MALAKLVSRRVTSRGLVTRVSLQGCDETRKPEMPIASEQWCSQRRLGECHCSESFGPKHLRDCVLLLFGADESECCLWLALYIIVMRCHGSCL